MRRPTRRRPTSSWCFPSITYTIYIYISTLFGQCWLSSESNFVFVYVIFRWSPRVTQLDDGLRRCGDGRRDARARAHPRREAHPA